MWLQWVFGPGMEVLWTGGLNRPISKPTLVGRCWPPGARPHSAPALALLETLRLLLFQRRQASGQRRLRETALSRGLGVVYPKPFNPPPPPPPPRPPVTFWQLQRRASVELLPLAVAACISMPLSSLSLTWKPPSGKEPDRGGVGGVSV